MFIDTDKMYHTVQKNLVRIDRSCQIELQSSVHGKSMSSLLMRELGEKETFVQCSTCERGTRGKIHLSPEEKLRVERVLIFFYKKNIKLHVKFSKETLSIYK